MLKKVAVLVMQTKSEQKTINIYRHGFYDLLFNNNSKGFDYNGCYFMNMAHYYQYYIAPEKHKQHVLMATCISKAEAYNWESYPIAKDPEKHIMKYDATETIRRLLDALIENCKQNSCIKTMLKLTGCARLLYVDDDDSFLGVGRDNRGLNTMGIVLMLARRYFTFKQRDSIAEYDLGMVILYITTIKKEQEEVKQLQKQIHAQLLQEMQDDTMPTLLTAAIPAPAPAPITVDVGGPLFTIHELDEEHDS